MRVIVTGSRSWIDYDAIHRELVQLPPGSTVVHGAHGLRRDGERPTKSADAMADWIAKSLGLIVERHYAEWNRHGNAAGPIRNTVMVRLGADACFAFPLPGGTGTADCMAKARRAGIPTGSGEALWAEVDAAFELWERAAMCEYHGDLSREEAERVARECAARAGLRGS